MTGVSGATRRLIRAAAVPAAVFVVFAVWLHAGWGGVAGRNALHVLASLGFIGFAGTSSGLAAWRSHGRPRYAWTMMTVGMGVLQVGAIALLYHRFWRKIASPVYPVPTMVSFIVVPLIASGALLILPGRYLRVARFRMLLDGAIMAASLFVVTWVTVVREVFANTNVHGLEEILAIGSPVGGVVTVTVAVLVLVRANPQWRQTLRVLAFGLTLIAASCGAYVVLLVRNIFLFDHILGLGWVAGLVLIGVAAQISPTDPIEASNDPIGTITPISLWLPYIPMAIAGLLEFARFRETLQADPALAATPWLVIAVLGRQFMVVAENRRLLHTASDRALRDPLTNLANRVLFRDRLDHAMQLHHRDRRPVAVLSMDLDDFKLINDHLGHPAGDALLVQAGQRLTSCVRAGDTVARLGGDEFAVLIEDAGENAHLIVYQVMEAFERPFSADGEIIFMRPSAGLAVADPDNPDVRADGLLKQADMALYSAKRTGGGLQTFSPDLYVDDDIAGPFSTSDSQSPRDGLVEVRLLTDLRQAINQQALTVLYQPKVDLRTTRVVGAEALVRWPHPVFGMVQPQQFLPLVRQHGLMRTFTDLILDHALDDAARWCRQGIAVPVAVNLFPPLAGDVNLPSRVFDALERHELPGDSLIVEITEDLLLDNIDRTRYVLEALREKNIHIALDDFGSGYSALTYLRKLPIDEVKVDYDLISNVLTDPRAEAIVRAVIDLAHVLGVTTVAEGVENSEIAAWLRDRGCEVAQGILYSPPITSTALTELLLSPAPR